MSKKSEYDDIIYAIKPEKLKEMADQLEGFIDNVDRFLFIEGMTDEEYEKYMKICRKAIKRLRKGKKLEGIIDSEVIERCIQEDPSFANEYLKPDYY